MNIEDVLKSRRQIKIFDNENYPEESVIESLLEKVHDIVPSKQNVMPYSILALGPNKKSEKEKLYKIVEGNYEGEVGKDANGNKRLDCTNAQIFAPYVLIYTIRLCIPNESMMERIKRGHDYVQCNPKTYKSLGSQQSVSLEVGMHAAITSLLCLNQGLDVSYTKCFPHWGPRNPKDHWRTQPWLSLDFVKEAPQLILSIGHKKEISNTLEKEYKPDFDEVFNWV